MVEQLQSGFEIFPGQSKSAAALLFILLRIQSSTGLLAGDARAVSETLVRAIPRHPGS